jgi:CRP/FNR family transcriptional regulator
MVMSVPDETTIELAAVRRLFTQPELHAPRRIVAAGDAIHQPDTPATSVYFIERGEVRILQNGPDGSCHLVEILGPGDWFGVAALSGSATCQKRAIAVTPASIAEVSVTEFLAALERDPVGCVVFVRELARRLHESRINASRFVFDDCERRVVKTLIDFSRTAAATTLDGGDEVCLRITHQQLAQAIGVARETVSLTLTKLRRQQLVQTGRNRLIFKPASLHDFASRGPVASN